MKRSKRSRACEFSQKSRAAVHERDKGCIFCRRGYRMEGADRISQAAIQIMHFIPRSQGGLGIPENGAEGCVYHHNMLDNGSLGNREEMMGIFEKHLRKCYPDWDRRRLVYSKWNY